MNEIIELETESVFEGKEDKSSVQLWVSHRTKKELFALKRDIEIVIGSDLTHDQFIRGIVRSRFVIIQQLNADKEQPKHEEIL